MRAASAQAGGRTSTPVHPGRTLQRTGHFVTSVRALERQGHGCAINQGKLSARGQRNRLAPGTGSGAPRASGTFSTVTPSEADPRRPSLAPLVKELEREALTEDGSTIAATGLQAPWRSETGNASGAKKKGWDEEAQTLRGHTPRRP